MGAKESTVSTGTKGTKVPNGHSEARHLATQRQHLPPLLLRDRPTELLLQPLRHLGESRIFVGILAFLHPLFELRELLHAHERTLPSKSYACDAPQSMRLQFAAV